MGEYDDRVSSTITEHLRMSRQSNCRVWFTSWFGIGDATDTTTIKILTHQNLHDQKIAIHYESQSRLRKKDNNDIFANHTHYYTLNGEANVDGDGVAKDMKHFCEKYFNHPNYYKIDGRPVIVLYLSRVLDDVLPGVPEEAGADYVWGQNEFLSAVITKMRDSSLQNCRRDPYIIGDHAFGDFKSSRDSIPLELLDAITK